ncbi:MAG: imidazoleglycerol-phosphate dehydratase HisB [Clostridiaceae bacterium]
MTRKSEIKRKTKETDVTLILNLDGERNIDINTGIGFFDHMLNLMAFHGTFDMDLKCSGDLYVDGHHMVEDTGIVFGKAFKEALGDKIGINRYSNIYTPMDEALSMVSIDISGRSFLHFNVPLKREKIGDFETELLEEFFRAFSYNAEITLHLNLIYGSNDHHIAESIFKGLGRALKEASKIDKEGSLPSTKGML